MVLVIRHTCREPGTAERRTRSGLLSCLTLVTSTMVTNIPESLSARERGRHELARLGRRNETRSTGRRAVYQETASQERETVSTINDPVGRCPNKTRHG